MNGRSATLIVRGANISRLIRVARSACACVLILPYTTRTPGRTSLPPTRVTRISPPSPTLRTTELSITESPPNSSVFGAPVPQSNFTGPTTA